MSTSTGWKEAPELPDSVWRAETVSWQSERMLPATATEAPSLASCWHTARPIPVPPPAGGGGGKEELCCVHIIIFYYN